MAQVEPQTKILEPIPALVRVGRPLKTSNGQRPTSNTSTSIVPPMPQELPVGIWSQQAIKVLEERYLLKDQEGKVLETPDQMCWRVAWDIACAEGNYGHGYEEILTLAKTYYQLLSSHEFLPNSPTLMNAGKNNGLQYSACYVIPVEDSIEGIFDGIKYAAIIHKSGGGTGFSFSRLRPANSRVGSTKGIASGPVSFMKIYDAATEQVKQGGARRGANMGILRVDHPDIWEFIHCKENGGINNFNISVAITDKFMEAFKNKTSYDLVDPKTKQVAGQLEAQKVMGEIAQLAWKTGDPGMVFLDRMNAGVGNPVPSLGPVESTNPCGEQILYPFDVCNLGSIFLTYFVRPVQDGSRQVEIDWERLKIVTQLAIRFLDSVIDRNPFPLPQVKEMAQNIRRIGLGVGGWADLLIQLKIPYDSDEALQLAEKLMKFISDAAREQSQKLAQERGPFPLFNESIYKDSSPVRNATLTTIAPTGSIGIIANTSTGIEPLFAIAYQHNNQQGREMTFFNPLFENYASQKDWYTPTVKEKISKAGTLAHVDEAPLEVKKIFPTAHDISYDWHVKMQAAFQKYTDNAVSKTINMINSASPEDVLKSYLLAYDSGCLGITVYRDGCKDAQVLNLGTAKKANGHAAVSAVSVPVELQPRPVKVEGATYRIETPLGTAFITVNHSASGDPFELFINIGRAGSEVAAMAEAIGRLISTTLRFGNHLPAKDRAREIVDQLRGIGGANAVGFGADRVRSLPDAVAKAIAMHFDLNGKTESVSEPISNFKFQIENSSAVKRDLCPSCGAAAFVFEEGCSKCHSCGYAKC